MRPTHFKYLLAFNIALVAIVWLVRPEWFEWAIALALVLTIIEVVVVSLTQDGHQ